MEEQWEFLEPWGCVLRDRMDLIYYHFMRPSERDVFVTVSFRCSLSPDNRPKTAWERQQEHQLIEVDVPANGRDQQKLRETMELFNMLAAVNNEVFKTLTAKYMGVPAFAEDPKVLFPNWFLKLKGKIPSEDPVTTLATVTWGELFGCSKDPRKYSPQFREAMTKLESIGLEGQRWLYQSAEYEMDVGLFFRFIGLRGKQRAAVSDADCDATATTEQFSCHLSRFFSFRAPPSVHLSVVKDTAKLAEAWKRVPMAPRDEAVIDRMDWLSSPYLDLQERASLSVNDVAAVFSQSDSKYIKIILNYAANRAQGMIMANFGFLISGLVCGRSLCGSVDGVHGFSLKDQRKDRALELTFDHEPDARFFAITSALTEADRLEKFSIGRWIKQNGPVGPAPIRDVCWGWLAIALWGKSSKCTAREVKIHGMDLTEFGVAAFKAALKINFPEPESDSSRSPQYGYINLQAGTQLHTLGLGRIDQTKFELLHDCRCRALISHTSMHGEASVVVPGHGICGVKLRNDRNDFVRDIQVTSDGESNPISTISTGIRSLKLVFSEFESGVLMMELLPLIGASLRSLSIDMIPPSHAEVDLSLLAASCPHLMSLSGVGINLSVSDHSKALGEWGLKQLVLKHPNNQATLETCLSCLTNTTQRMSQELVELTIRLPEVQATAYTIAMDALKECSGTFLPVAKEKFPLLSKAAVISTVKMGNGRKRSVGGAKAIHRLDENVMGLIFEYSATPEQRSVRIIQTK